MLQEGLLVESLRIRLLEAEDKDCYVRAHAVEIKDAYQLNDVIDLLTHESRSHFAIEQREKITDINGLTLILNQIAFQDRIDLAEAKIELIKNSEDLRRVLCYLPIFRHAQFQTRCPGIGLMASIREADLRNPGEGVVTLASVQSYHPRRPTGGPWGLLDNSDFTGETQLCCVIL